MKKNIQMYEREREGERNKCLSWVLECPFKSVCFWGFVSKVSN